MGEDMAMGGVLYVEHNDELIPISSEVTELESMEIQGECEPIRISNKPISITMKLSKGFQENLKLMIDLQEEKRVINEREFRTARRLQR